MKKFAVILLAAASVLSCTKEQFGTESNGAGFVRFSISSEGTKSYLTDDYHICWEAGKDKISLFSKASNYPFTVTANGTSTWIEGTIQEVTSRYYAIYPYDPQASNSTGFVTTTLPSSQKAIVNQYSNILAVGSTNGADLHFQNCVSLVEVDLRTDGVTSISFRGNNGELIAGTVRISIPSKDDTAPVATVINGSKEVSISDNGNVLKQGRYYLAVIPNEFKRGVTITLDGDNGTATRLTTRSVTANRSRRLLAGTMDMPLKAKDGGFSFSYDDGTRQGTIYPGEKRTLVYSYSGCSSINYSISHGNFTQEVFFDGNDSPADDFQDRIGSGISSMTGTLDLLPTSGSGGSNDNIARLRAATPRGSLSSPVNLAEAGSNLPGVSLSGLNTANCYIVRAPGWYCFPLVYGNAIKNGSPNRQAYAPETGGSALSPFVDANGNGISSPYINASSLRLEWTDALGLVNSDVTLAEVSGTASAVFEVPASTIREGNAVISALDSGGKVLWSWHIWVTGASDSELSPVAVTNKDNKTFNMMRLNLGWVAPYSTPLVYPGRKTMIRLTENGTGQTIEFTLLQMGASLPANSYGNCPFYQWGRKDPFVSGDGTTTTDDSGNFTKKTWYTSERRDTIGTRAAILGDGAAALIGNPTVYNITSGGDGKYYNYWNANQAQVGKTDVIVKTVYDPCPAGYSLPSANVWSAFSTSNADGFRDGWSFYCKPGKEGGTIFFPACGSMSTSNSTSTSVFGSLRNVNANCSYWSGNPNNLTSAYYLYATSTAVNTGYGANRQYVYPIRPAME